jgi:hypothetical protein
MIYGDFSVEGYAWWERLPITIVNVGPTEFIAVGNRSHNIFNLCSGTIKLLFPLFYRKVRGDIVFDQAGRLGSQRSAAEHLKPSSISRHPTVCCRLKEFNKLFARGLLQ